MEKPKEYLVNPQASEQDFLNAGFEKYDGVYRIKHVLYKYQDKSSYITLVLLIEQDWIVINVSKDTGDTYAPFYNPDLRHDNAVCDEVISNYNKFMNKLVYNRVLRHTKRTKNGRNKN